MGIKISIVIPNWNGASLLQKNLPQVVKAKGYSRNRIIEIIVVDDASSDNSLKILKKYFYKDVIVIKHKTNRRFAAAVNTGVKYAKGTHICLLNTDVVPHTSFLEHTIKYLENPGVFGVTLHEIGYGPAEGSFNGFLQHRSGSESGGARETLWISGGSGVFSKKLYTSLKGFDQDLYAPFYWEDVDLGYRAHKRGYKLIWEPKAFVEHKHESINSSNFSAQYLSKIKERNELLFNWRNITSKNMYKAHRMALVKRILKHPGYLKIFIMALAKWRLVLAKRNKERLEAIVSDEAIMAKFSK